MKNTTRKKLPGFAIASFALPLAVLVVAFLFSLTGDLWAPFIARIIGVAIFMKANFIGLILSLIAFKKDENFFLCFIGFVLNGFFVLTYIGLALTG